jgi:hypothetical protein
MPAERASTHAKVFRDGSSLYLAAGKHAEEVALDDTPQPWCGAPLLEQNVSMSFQDLQQVTVL